MPVASSKKDSNKIPASASRRADTTDTSADSPNIGWFFEKDVDQSGSLTLAELWVKYAENNWYNQRYQTAIEKLIYEADLNRDRAIDMAEYIK